MTRVPDVDRQLRAALGAELARYRMQSPLSQGDIAQRVNYSRTSISHVEAGRQCPERGFWLTVDKVLDANGTLVAMYDDVRERTQQLMIAELEGSTKVRPGGGSSYTCTDDWQRDDDVNRRELLRLISATGSILVLPGLDVDQVKYAATRPQNLDHATVGTYERINASLWSEFSQTRLKKSILPKVRRHLTSLSTSLRHPQQQDVRRRLCFMLGDLFQLCGEIFFDSDNYTDACSCYSLAAQASREAADFDLWACAMIRHAFVTIYERDYAGALPLLDGAAQLAVRGDPSRTTRFWAAAVQAQASAGMGDLLACERALDRAGSVTALDNAPVSGWLRFEGSRLDEERGACYVTLGHPDKAEPALNTAMKQSISTRRRGSLLTDLAVAGTQRGDLDQALLYGSAALDTVRQTGSAGYVGRKLTELSRQFEPHLADRHIRYLNNTIRDTVFARTSPIR